MFGRKSKQKEEIDSKSLDRVIDDLRSQIFDKKNETVSYIKNSTEDKKIGVSILPSDSKNNKTQIANKVSRASTCKKRQETSNIKDKQVKKEESKIKSSLNERIKACQRRKREEQLKKEELLKKKSRCVNKQANQKTINFLKLKTKFLEASRDFESFLLSKALG